MSVYTRYNQFSEVALMNTWIQNESKNNIDQLFSLLQTYKHFNDLLSQRKGNCEKKT